jgi:hypothetical protein
MSPVSSFVSLLATFAPLMTPTTFENFRLLASGWVLSTRRRTVTELIQRAGAVDLKSFSTFHRFFNRAQWSIDDAGRLVLGFVLRLIPREAVVQLVVDDTLCKKRGLHVFGTGMHRDALASTRKLVTLSWGHNWVVVGVVVQFPFAPGISWCLPFAFRLYVTKNRPKSQRWVGPERPYRTRPELAVEILEMVAKWHPDRRFELVGDSAYGGGSVLTKLPANFDLTSRIVTDARLFAAAPTRRRGVVGRPRRKGKRLPSPSQLASSRKRWKRLALVLYGGRRRVLLVKESEGLWPKGDYRRIKVVVVRDPRGVNKDEAFYSTNTKSSESAILQSYARRWSIEVAFENAKTHFGFEDPQNRTARAVERTAPLGALLYSLVVVWFQAHGHKKCRFRNRPWYTSKSTASFEDMVDTLRLESLRGHFCVIPGSYRGRRNALNAACAALGLAS